MLRNFFFTLILLLSFLTSISCENIKNSADDENSLRDESNVNDTSITNDENINHEIQENENFDDDSTDSYDSETIETDNDTAFQDEKNCDENLEIGYENYCYLRMSGIVQSYGNIFNATISSSILTGDVEEIKFENGVYFSSKGITAKLQNSKTRESEKYGTIIEKDEATFSFSPGGIDKMLDVGAYGAHFISTRSFFSLNETKEVLRKKCYIATDVLWDYEDPYWECIIDIPSGRIRGCFDGKRDFKAGDFLEMQFLNKIDILPDKILQRINWVSWDKSLEYGEDGFQNICTCYNENGQTLGLQTWEIDPNEVKCWEYEGPGGTEEKPDYVND